MPDVEIRYATRRDICYVAANASPIDKAEILASGPRNMTECGYLTWEAMDTFGGVGWCAWLDGNPEFCFGFTPPNALQMHMLLAWAWGTKKTAIVMPEVVRWSKGEGGRPNLIQRLDLLKCQRIEARSLWNHYTAHRWLEWIGFRKDCDLPDWGVHKERFVQYRWLRSEFAGFGKHGNATWRKDHVHVSARSPAPARSPINRRAGRNQPGA